MFPDSFTVLHENVNQVFDELGPTPRICIDYLLADKLIERYREEVRKAILMVTTQQLRIDDLFDTSRTLAGNEVSDRICLIRREEKEDFYSLAAVSFITRTIKSRLLNGLENS